MNKHLAHSKFEYIASSFPGNIAIEQGETRVTYTQLNEFSNKVAHALLATGLGKGTIAGAWFGNCIEYVASVLGINKAGMVFMPLDPDFPVKRQAQLLNSAGLSLLVADRRLLPEALRLLTDPDIGQREIMILAVDTDSITVHDRQGDLLADRQYPTENPRVELNGNDTNYLIYTSGSTGQPKIIEGCHKGLSHFIHWEIEEFGLDRYTKVSQVTPLSFDVSFRDIFVPLLTGGTLCIPDKEVRFNPALLLSWLASAGITLFHCVPSLFRLLTEELQSVPDPRNALSSLKFILLAGEPLFGKDVTNWRTIAGDQTELVNVYGPTETTLAKLFYRIKDPTFGPASIVPLGKAISNTAVLILNDAGRLCPIGEPGNIYIKTPFRSKGYYRQPELTKEKFIQNPLHGDFEDIIYHTGDTGKYLEDLNVVFLGRNDNQVKVRGNRIELLEVEKVLSSFPGVRGVAVTVIQMENEADSVLACYYTGAKIDEGKVKSYLGNFLSQYMHPSHYIHLAAFPLNSSGKIDRRSLPIPDNLENNDYEPPAGELERKIENIWKEVLKVPRVSRNESFFNIGGSSLRGIKVISKIYKECNVLLKLPDLFANPTIQQLCTLLNASTRQQYAEIRPTGIKPWYPLSSAQKRLWILSHFENQNIAYNLLNAFRISGELDIRALERALHAIVDRHEIMRTVFISIDGEPMQKILPVVELGPILLQEDLRDLPDPAEKAHQLTSAEWTTPFDLKEGPLFRTRLLRTADDEFVFIFSRHHIISDGWSSGLWIKEVRELYDAFVDGKPNPLQPLKIQYKDFAAWQNDLLQGDKLNKYQDYWVSRFTPAPPYLEVPADKVRPAVKTFSGRHYGTSFDNRLVRSLTEICNKKGATLFMGLLTALYALFYRLTGQQDITVGTPITGREHDDLENQMGIFVNTLALRAQLEDEDSFLSLLGKVREIASGAYEHQIYPFDYLVDQLDVTRDLSHSPLFEVMIVMHDAKASQTTGADFGNMSVYQFYAPPVV
ncbi:MAG TPA: amino acid adenylation domain-containing protein, partial [Puia sp.]|nr:amino acid adenylation domain-containing protein [Puia sp.]